MNGLINLIQGNGKETQLSAVEANSVSLENISRVDLPFNRDDINKITFEEGKLGLHLRDGSKVTFEAVIDQLGALVPIYEESGSLLFNDLGEILAQLETTAAGPEPLPTVEGTSSYAPEDNNFRVDLVDGVDTYRDLRGPLDNPVFTSTTFDGLNTENEVLDNDAIDNEPPVASINNAPVIETLSATDVLEDILTGNLTETVTDADTNSSYNFVANTVVATVTSSAQFNSSDIVSGVQVTIASDGSYTVSGSGIEALSEGESATISFDVKVIDDQSAESLPKTVTLNIIGSNDGPVIQTLNATDVQENILTGSLNEVVSDADANSSYDFVAETVNATVTASAQNGSSNIVSNVTVSILANGDYSVSGSGIEALSEGETASISFAVKVVDDQSAESLPKTVTLNIIGSNDGPAIQTLSATDVQENILTGSLSEVVTDADANSSYDFVAENIAATVTSSAQHNGSDIVSGIQVSIASDGSYTISGSGIEALSDGETASISFAVRVVDDQSAESAARTVSLDIIGSNDAPLITALSTSDVQENTLTGSLTETVTDADANSSYNFVAGTVEATVIASAQHGGNDIVSGLQVSIASDGSYTVSGSGIEALSIGESATISFDVNVIDDQSAESLPKTVTLNIIGSNDAPIIQALTASDVLEDILTGSLTETVTDADANSSYNFVAGTVEATVIASAQHGGNDIVSGIQVSIASDGSYTISGSGIEALSIGESATISFDVKVIDDQSAESLPKTVTLNIIGSNDAPVITALSTADVFEDNLTGSLNETVTDADANSSYDFVAETVTATVTSSAQHGGIDIVSDVQVTIDINGDYSITGSGIDALSIGESAEISFTVKVIDDQSAESVEQQVSLSILGKHFNPRLDSVVSNSINDFARSKTLTLNQKQLWQNDLDGDGHNDITDGDFPPPFTNASGYWKTLDIIESSVKVTGITFDDGTGSNLNLSTIGLDEAVLKNLYNDPSTDLLEIINTDNAADFVRFHINDNAFPDSDFKFLNHGESLNFTIEYRLIDGAGNPSNLTTTTMTVEGHVYRLAGSNLFLTDDALDIDLLLTDPSLSNSISEVKLALSSSQTLSNIDAQDILDLSSTDTLIISGNANDSIGVLGSNWTDSGTETIGSQLFNVFEKDSAILKVDADIDTTIDTI